MALGDYILCCKCDTKLIYDGDRGQREWWKQRFGKPPEIECPNCKAQRTWLGLTQDEFKQIMLDTYNIDLNVPGHSSDDHLLWRAIEAKLKEKNT